MTKKIFVTGISTDVGKTVISAILVEALKADYWKPVQAGDLDIGGDTQRVKDLVSNKKSKFHQPAYELSSPMSPHAAAAIDGVNIDVDKIKVPETDNDFIVIEGAGGLLVPLNEKDTILDIIPKDALVIVVSKNYLGSINHSLLTINLLTTNGFDVSLIFNGEENKDSQNAILSLSSVKYLGLIDLCGFMGADFILKTTKTLRLDKISH